MNARNSRESRKAAREAANIVAGDAAVAIERVVAYMVHIDGRTKALTDYAEKTELLAQSLADWRARPFLGRMRWFLLGR